MADAGGPDLTGAWQDAITAAERALRGDRVTRAQVVTTVEVLCEGLQLLDRPSVGRHINYLVSLLDFLGLYDTSRVLLEHVASCFVLDPPALNMDAAVRNQLAVTFAERGHLPAAARLLTGSAKGSVWTAATLANQACVMLRRRDVERAVDAAFRARQAVVPAEGDDETEEELDVHVLATAVLAQVARMGGLHAVADELVDELEGFVRRLVRLLGGDHPKSLSALVTLAWAEFESAREAGESQRIERAGDVIALAAQRMSAILGTEHPRSLSVLQIMATVEHETAWVLGSDRRLQGANALMRATVRRADGLRRWDPWSLGLDETIEVERAAVAAIPVGHPDRAVHLTRFSNALQARFKHTGNPEALFEAIEVGRAAIAATPDDHRDRAARLTNLNFALQAWLARSGNLHSRWERFERTRAMQDFEDPLAVWERLARLAPPDPSHDSDADR
ncbi:hypothetical protein ACFY3M_53105 [Streptomyces mirabilis]|uniref:hypothetical protein n=1 Tax=Streptomyces mirabilis TaxID=68239 RepID=UPI00367DA673